MNNTNESNKPGNFHHRIAYIIPTRNRPRMLARLLDSIKIQSVAPDQVIIGDGSDQPIESEIKSYLNDTISYLRIFPPGLTKQRNEGRKALREHITLVGYLDDDLVLEKDATESMMRFWETAPQVLGGAAFYIEDTPFNKANLLTKLFCINSGEKGKVMKSGSSTSYAPVSETLNVEWLCGGATVWRRNIFKEFSFDEWYRGWAYFEDLDFSFSISKKHKLALIHSAKVQHLPPPLIPKKISAFNKTHIIQQYYFVRKHHELSIAHFYWSVIGSIIISSLVGIKRLRPSQFAVVRGYISGLFAIMTGNMTQHDEAFRKESSFVKDGTDSDKKL